MSHASQVPGTNCGRVDIPGIYTLEHHDPIVDKKGSHER